MRARNVGLFALSAATLMYELALTRIFAVAQGYHFAFLSLSLALLGFGASGAWLAGRRGTGSRVRLDLLAAATALSIVASYLVLNWFPFDAYTIAWDARQLWLVAIDYAALVVPFLLAGAATGLSLSVWPEAAAELYAANLAGSAIGSVAVLGALAALGGAGAVVLSAALAALAALIFTWGVDGPGIRVRRTLWAVELAGLAALALRPPDALDVRLSAYRPLSYVLRHSGAQIVYQRWNAYSRLDIVASPGIHSAPGLSLRYTGMPPEQMGLTVDGGDLSAVTRSPSPDEAGFLQALQGSLPHRLRPGGQVLVLSPRGGLDLLLALRLGAREVDVVVSNPGIVHALRDLYGGYTGGIYDDSRVQVHMVSTRSFLARAPGPYDLIVFSLPQGYRSVRAGSYALGENYDYTEEAFEAGLRSLAPEGLLVAQGWLQTPASETVRLAGLAGRALARLGVADPRCHVVAYRDWTLMTLLVKRGPWVAPELAQLRALCLERGFDLVAAPDIRPEEMNRYHVLTTPAHDEACQRVLHPTEWAAFVARYPYDLSPTRDERPFFAHTFRWQQLPSAWRSLGRSAEPFGGGGYLVLLVLLGLAVVTSVCLVGYTVRRAGARTPGLPALAYFVLIGAGYITVELVLMQRAILLLDQPTYAFAAVLATLLLASGAGSRLSGRLPPTVVILVLAAGLGILAWVWPPLAQTLLKHSITVRFATICGLTAPFGVLMGVPFPSGLARQAGRGPLAVAAIWAANGCASVVGSIVTTLAVLSVGFGWVLTAAACCYLLAGVALLAEGKSAVAVPFRRAKGAPLGSGLGH